jgi:hypothetical protein
MGSRRRAELSRESGKKEGEPFRLAWVGPHRPHRAAPFLHLRRHPVCVYSTIKILFVKEIPGTSKKILSPAYRIRVV